MSEFGDQKNGLNQNQPDLEVDAASLRDSRQPDFQVGDFLARPLLNELEKDGKVSRIEARSMEMLLCLASHAPKVVSKRRAIEEVWKSAHIGDEVVSHAIWDLRKAFGDNAKNPTYIHTISRKGYRLLADVRWLIESEDSPDTAVLLSGSKLESYEIVEELGRGSMGVVFKAYDQRLDREVALKFLAAELVDDADACRRFRREARLAASLDHLNLATVFDVGETAEGRQFIATAYYSGGSLKDRLAEDRLEEEGAVQICIQIAEGLRVAHENGIVHRDIKPANILFAADGTVKVADFGIAKLLGGSGGTRTGVSVGTPAYKSPEQSRGIELDHRSDIWSLGVVLFEMINGERPFRADFEQEVVHAVLSPTRESAQNVVEISISDPLKSVIQKMVSKKPEDRYQTTIDLIEDLENLEEGTDAEIPTPAGEPGVFNTQWIYTSFLLMGSLSIAFWGFQTGWSFSETKDLSPLEVQRLIGQGIHYEHRGDDVENTEKAEALYRKALKAAPGHAEANARLAILLTVRQEQIQTKGTLEEIENLVEKAVASDPELALGWAAKARSALLAGNADGAATAANRAVELEPDCARDRECDQGYTALGEALLEQGDTEKGLELIRRGTEVGRGHIRARQVLAQRLWNLGDLSAAAVEYEKILEYAPDYPAALNNLGLIYLGMNRNLEATGIFKRLLEKKKDFRFANNLGVALYNREKWDGAAQAFEVGYELNPLSPTAPMGLGDTFLTRGDEEKATRWYQIALENYDRILAQESSPLDRKGQRAVCLAKLGRILEAEKEIEQLLLEDPDRGSLLCYAARIYALDHNRDLLFKYSQRAVQSGYSPERLLGDPSFRPYLNDSDFLTVLEVSSVGSIKP